MLRRPLAGAPADAGARPQLLEARPSHLPAAVLFSVLLLADNCKNGSADRCRGLLERVLGRSGDRSRRSSRSSHGSALETEGGDAATPPDVQVPVSLHDEDPARAQLLADAF